MRDKLALPIAYVAAVAVTPILFYAVATTIPFPAPRARMFMTLSEAYRLDCLLALIGAFPGFAATRAIIWGMGTRSAFSFLVAGALTGWVACLILIWPVYPWVALDDKLLVVAAVIGAVAAMVYWWVESVISGRGTWIEGRGKWRFVGATD